MIRFQTKSGTTTLKLLTCGQSWPDIWLPTYVECDISKVLLLLVYLIPFRAGKLKEKVWVVVGDVMISTSLVYKWRPRRGESWVRPWTYEASLSFLLPCPCSNKLLIGAQRSLVNCCCSLCRQTLLPQQFLVWQIIVDLYFQLNCLLYLKLSNQLSCTIRNVSRVMDFLHKIILISQVFLYVYAVQLFNNLYRILQVWVTVEFWSINLVYWRIISCSKSHSPNFIYRIQPREHYRFERNFRYCRFGFEAATATTKKAQ